VQEQFGQRQPSRGAATNAAIEASRFPKSNQREQKKRRSGVEAGRCRIRRRKHIIRKEGIAGLAWKRRGRIP